MPTFMFADHHADLHVGIDLGACDPQTAVEPQTTVELRKKSSLKRENLLKDVLCRNSLGRLFSGGTICTWTGGKLVGLGVEPFGDDFDKHFEIDSAKMFLILCDDQENTSDLVTGVSKYELAATSTSRTSRHSSSHGTSDISQWRDFFTSCKNQPSSWNLPVRFVVKLWEYIANDLEQYAASHCFNDEFDHVCLSPACSWHHTELPSAYIKDQRVKALRPDMHLVVQRYIKPWTRNFQDAGMALLYQAGNVSLHREVALEDTVRPSVFISHCWGEIFRSFVKTLKRTLDPETQIWVCSFAIWQHGDVAEQLSSLELSPFAVALAASERVLVVTDQSIEVLSRCWCVLEATFALKWNKPYDVCIEEDMSLPSWSSVSRVVAELSLENCLATYEEDKDAILAYAQNCEGGIHVLNDVVREVFRKASERARLSTAASKGDLAVLQEADAIALRELRDARGRGILHVAAIRGQISSMMHIAQHLDKSDFDMLDNEGKSPLCVAAHAGAISGVQGLLTLKADLEASSKGLTPLHYAALAGSTKIALMLIHGLANVEAAGTYRDNHGWRPLHLAAKTGHAEVTRLLIQRRAAFDALTTNGSTALFQAAHAGHTQVVVALVSAKVDTNAQNMDKFKRAPLMAAAKNNSVSLVCILLEARADINLADASGLTCLDYCTRSGSYEAEFIIDILSNAQKFQRRQQSRGSCVTCKCVVS